MKAVLAGVALLVLLANCNGASGSRGLLGTIHILRNHFTRHFIDPQTPFINKH